MLCKAWNSQQKDAYNVQALLEKVKRQLDAKRFMEFRQSVAAFMRGETDATVYHKIVETLGLAHLVPEMASLLPEPSKRAALLSAHEAAASTFSRYIPFVKAIWPRILHTFLQDRKEIA